VRFEAPLIRATLLGRRQRFLADVRLDDGEIVTAFCPNTGRMLGYSTPGMPVWLSEHDKPNRRCRYVWELSETPNSLVLAHPARSNALARDAIAAALIPELAGYTAILREVRYGDEGSRIDLLLEAPPRESCYVEVKSVTAIDAERVGVFPDAVSTRGAKHMRELARERLRGRRAVVLFFAQRNDTIAVRPCDEIDPRYGVALRAALADGVEAIAYRCEITTAGIAVAARIPVVV